MDALAREIAAQLPGWWYVAGVENDAGWALLAELDGEVGRTVSVTVPAPATAEDALRAGLAEALT